jgi:hypothetical protein
MKDFSFAPELKEFEHDGTTITMKLRPLKVKAMAKLLPVIEGMSEKDEGKKDLSAAFELLEAAQPVLVEHVTEITGFTIDGAPPTWERICEETSMVSLVSEVINTLFAMSMPEKEVDEGNS